MAFFLSSLLALAWDAPAHTVLHTCPRYGGKTCAGHGTCTQHATGASCVCEEGYMHADCSYAGFCPKDCSGHGVCRVPTGYNKTIHPGDLGYCACYDGYRGVGCEEMTMLNDSLAAGCTAFCSGHGRCLCSRPRRNRHSTVHLLGGARPQGQSRLTLTERAGEANSCSCACDQGYVGAGCDDVAEPTCPNSCSGHGVCGPLCGGVLCGESAGGLWGSSSGPYSRTYGCTCDPGFGGADCGHAVPQPGCPSSCSGHGLCRDSTCVCETGFKGAACDTLEVAVLSAAAAKAAANKMAEVEAHAKKTFRAEARQQAQQAQQEQQHRSMSLGESQMQMEEAAAARALQAQQATAQQGDSGRGPAPAGLTLRRPDWEQEGGIFLARVDAAGRARGVTREAALAGAANESRAPGCALGCSGRGYCRASLACECEDGFGGLACDELRPACPANCSARGRCAYGVCQCDVGSYGAMCHLAAPPGYAGPTSCQYGCSGHGSCVLGTCVCTEGFLGAACNQLQAHSAAQPSPCKYGCSGHGSCDVRTPMARLAGRPGRAQLAAAAESRRAAADAAAAAAADGLRAAATKQHKTLLAACALASGHAGC